ncbi:MAG: hypothetical protein PHY12_10315 [Eubacteriales bacterium]|nr:hypothetical protein [Eubacteriales bacterium]
MTRTSAGTRARALTAAFFALLVLAGLLTCGGYGQPWDEPWEMDILRMNLNEYAALLGSDSRLALESSVEKPESGRISDSVEKDHGVSAYLPVGWLVAAPMDAAARMQLWHMWTWLLFALGAGALYAISRRLGLSRVLAGAAALLLVLSPRFFAEGHYNNKDVVLLSLTLCCVWQAMRLMEKQSVPRALCFALFGALAANTKVAGLAVWGLCGLAVLAHCLAAKKKGWLPAMLWAMAGFAALYALLTPALLGDPAGYLAYAVQNALSFTRWDHYVLFRGAVFWLKTQPLPRYYLPLMIAVTTPLCVLALAAVGQASALRRARHQPIFSDATTLSLLLCTALWALPLGLAVATGARAYNGWRHYYFVYGPMLVLAAWGLRALAHVRRARARNALLALVAAGLLLCGVEVATGHPHQYAYYNALARRDAAANRYELDYWNVSALGALEQACGLESGEVRIAGVDAWAQTGLENAAAVLPGALRGRVRVLPMGSPEADYLLENPTYAVLSGWSPGAGEELIAEESAYGAALMRVYRRGAQAGGTEE